ncbi:putative ATPase/DNA helicase [Betaentomopoxvirus amoorei]|uniref:AMV039 n=1 Tax=Amsacta moorei entomopoxvirus TaxID=28321 RepID=Q9EN09_AMEPV|nr:putative ATPase/DNA helicase [Amsacta moorei entomopoxvirus]AAG02745.1 AMV039 [Amsacta moorei entomopoxvirus]
MNISKNYPQCTLNDISVNLFDHQKRIIKYFYDVETKSIELQNNCLKLNNEIINIIKDFINLPSSILTLQIDIDDIIKLQNEKSKIYCLNDCSGSGKSYSLLGLIKYFKNNYIYTNEKLINITIIIVPFSLIDQWSTYASNMNIKFLILNRQKNFSYLEKINEYDLIIVSNTFIKKFIDYININNIKILRLIIDEPEFIIKNNIKIFDIIFKNSLLKYIIPSIYYDSIIYNNPKLNIIYVKSEEISIPLMNPTLISIDIKNITIKTVLKINNNDEELIKKFDVDTSDLSEEIYFYIFNKKTTIIKDMESNIIINEKNLNIDEVNKIKKEILYERKCINYIKERLLIKTCNICMSDFQNNKNVIICCINTICANCIQRIKDIRYIKCPYCNITSDNIENLIFSYDIIEKRMYEHLKKMIFPDDSKILIIGYYTLFIKIEELSIKWFNDSKYCKILNGNSTISNNMLKKFKQTDDIKILYFDSYSKICGFNMEFVTDLIFLTEIFSEQTKQKIIGKAQRLGRKKPLKIYNFVLPR